MRIFKRTPKPKASTQPAKVGLSHEAELAYMAILQEYENELQDILYDVFSAGCEMGMTQDDPDRHAIANQRLRSAQLQLRELNVSIISWKECAMSEAEIPLFEEVRQQVRQTMLESIAQDMDENWAA